MAKFTRKLNTRQRDAMIRRKQRAAALVAKLPRVETEFSASGGRTAAENITIARTHAKGGRVTRKAHMRNGRSVKAHDATYERRQVFRLTAAEVRAIQNSGPIRALLDDVRNGATGRLPAALDAIGAAMIAAYRSHPGLQDTGTLRGAIRARTVIP